MSTFFADLMVDQFGNYLSQKIFEVASLDELALLTEMIKPCLVEIAMDVHGTRAVQTLIEVLSKDVKLAEPVLFGIIAYLEPQIKTLSLVR